MFQPDKILFFFQACETLIASSILKAPKASAFAVYSGTSKETATCDCAAKLYISSGFVCLIILDTEEESVISP